MDFHKKSAQTFKTDQSKKSPTIDIDHQKELISSDEETPPIHNRFHFLDQQSFPPQSSAKGTDLDYSNLYKLEESVAANTQSVSRGFLNPSTECETSSEDSCEKSEFIFKPKTQQIPPKIGLDFLDQRENYSYLEFKRNSVTKDSNISYQRNVEERSHLYQTQSSLIKVKASSLEVNDLLSFQSDSRSRLQNPYNSFPLSNQSESSNNESALHLVNPVLQHLDECYENNGHSQKNYTNKHDSRVDSFNFSLGASNEPSMKESRLQIESNTRRDNSVIGKDKDTFSLSLSSADSHSLNFTDSQSLCLTGSHSISFTEVALSQNTRQSPRKILFNAEELERRQQMYKHEMGTLSFTEDS